MSLRMIVDGLYLEMLFVAMILLLIMLFDNIALYKQKLKDPLSLLLLSAVIMCGFEILWTLTDGKPGLTGVAYFGACGYMMSFVLFTMGLNRYILFKLDRLPKKQWMKIVFYYAPAAIFFAICVATPWTGWLMKADESGHLQDGPLYATVFNPLMLIYLISALLAAVEYAIRGRKENPAATQVAYSMIVFGILTPAVYLMEIAFLGADSNYLALSLAVSVALVYLTANISTQTLLDTQAKIEATESDLRVAAKIQTDMLPGDFPAFPEHREFELFASMDPAKEVGGDFYDFFMIDDTHLGIVMADVSGKGIPAALFMTKSMLIIRNCAMHGGDPAAALEKANKQICANNREDMFVTVWLGVLDIDSGIVTAANAGHEFPSIKRAGGGFEILKDRHGFVVGGLDMSRYKSYEIALSAGDELFLYTDGLPEATNVFNEQYGTDRMIPALNSVPDAKPEELLKAVRADVNAFVGSAPQFDDLTMLCLKYNGKVTEE